MHTAVEDGVRREPATMLDRGLAVALVLLAVALAALFVLGWSPTIDDGFYYLKIAQHVADGHGSTFDGVHLTNGYHPLWLVLLAALCRVAPPSRLLALDTLLQASCWGGAAALVHLTARRWFGLAASSAAALAWLAFTCREALAGLEFSLHALGIAATGYVYARLIEKERPSGTAAPLALGVLASLTVLARLETFLLAGLLLLALLARERSGGFPAGWPSRVAAFAAPVAFASLGYLVVNARLFGHAVPVSAAVKRAWSVALLHADPHYRSGGWLEAKAHHAAALVRFSLRQRRVLLAGTLAPLLLLALSRRLGRPFAPLRPFLDFQRPFVAYAATQLALCALVYHGSLSLSPWYFVAQPWLAALWAGALVSAFGRAVAGRGRAGAAALSIAWCVLPALLLSRLAGERTRLDPSRQPLLRAAEWARANIPEGATIGAWNAGTLGALSGRHVVNLDGVANSWEFFLAERGDLCSYWERVGITHLVDDFGPEGARSLVPARPAYERCSARLERVARVTGDGGDGFIEAYRIR